MDTSGEGFQTKKSLGNYIFLSHELNMLYQSTCSRGDFQAVYSITFLQSFSLYMLTGFVNLQIQLMDLVLSSAFGLKAYLLLQPQTQVKYYFPTTKTPMCYQYSGYKKDKTKHCTSYQENYRENSLPAENTSKYMFTAWGPRFQEIHLLMISIQS